ncbi:hypothetical protein Cpir12675_004242 [Ceratocystis pirilliformis]|uniref:Uncharacterized protein n=1 Tax=Ceratocystis pirilliformis TaxID=259994 RepID=A0ABR3YYA0_9PEZI
MSKTPRLALGRHSNKSQNAIETSPSSQQHSAEASSTEATATKGPGVPPKYPRNLQSQHSQQPQQPSQHHSHQQQFHSDPSAVPAPRGSLALGDLGSNGTGAPPSAAFELSESALPTPTGPLASAHSAAGPGLLPPKLQLQGIATPVIASSHSKTPHSAKVEDPGSESLLSPSTLQQQQQQQQQQFQYQQQQQSSHLQEHHHQFQQQRHSLEYQSQAQAQTQAHIQAYHQGGAPQPPGKYSDHQQQQYPAQHELQRQRQLEDQQSLHFSQSDSPDTLHHQQQHHQRHQHHSDQLLQPQQQQQQQQRAQYDHEQHLTAPSSPNLGHQSQPENQQPTAASPPKPHRRGHSKSQSQAQQSPLPTQEQPPPVQEKRASTRKFNLRNLLKSVGSQRHHDNPVSPSHDSRTANTNNSINTAVTSATATPPVNGALSPAPSVVIAGATLPDPPLAAVSATSVSASASGPTSAPASGISKPPSTYNNTAGLARRPSKRISTSASTSPSLRTPGQRLSQLAQDDQLSVISQWSQGQSQSQAQSQSQSPAQPQGYHHSQSLSCHHHHHGQSPSTSFFQQSPSSGVDEFDTKSQCKRDSSAIHQQHLSQPQKRTSLSASPTVSSTSINLYPQPDSASFTEDHNNNFVPYPPPKPPHPGQYHQQQQLHYLYSNPNGSQNLSLLSLHDTLDSVSQLSRDSPVDSLPSLNITTPIPAPAVAPAPSVYRPQQPVFADIQQQLSQPRASLEIDLSNCTPESILSPSPATTAPSQQLRSKNMPPAPSSQPNQSAAAQGNPPVYRSSDRAPTYEGNTETGRTSSPQPSTLEAAEEAYNGLNLKYKNVKRAYFEFKKENDKLSGQVEHLQNALANQRMSQSRTALDDNEYVTRFNRLSGAVTNLSFLIRKDWRQPPAWIMPFISPDGIKTGKQEMTAVGRAIITEWLYNNLFQKCFHPGLDSRLSEALKNIDICLRNPAYTFNSQEEWDALTSKLVNWRMATLEGLRPVLQSPVAEDNRLKFIQSKREELVATLHGFLVQPPPPDVEGSVLTIVELAVGIALNLPMESRDVAVLWPQPYDKVDPKLMDAEKTSLPAIKIDSDAAAAAAIAASAAANAASTAATAASGDAGDAAVASAAASAAAAAAANAAEKDKSKKPPPPDPSAVRFAGFLAVEVRGRQVLVRAPVWTIG